MCSHSRGAVSPELCNFVVPLNRRGRGEAGRQLHPQPRMQMKEAYERSHYRFSQFAPAFPAQWFYGFLRALPGEAAFLAPVAGGIFPPA